MDENYLYSEIGFTIKRAIYESTILIENKLYVVIFAKIGYIERIEVSCDGITKKVDARPNQLSWMRDLQFQCLTESPKTLLNSLELKQTIRELYN